MKSQVAQKILGAFVLLPLSIGLSTNLLADAATPTPSPTATASPTPSATATPSPSPSSSASPTPTASPSTTATPAPTATAKPATTAAPVAAAKPTATPAPKTQAATPLNATVNETIDSLPPDNLPLPNFSLNLNTNDQSSSSSPTSKKIYLAAILICLLVFGYILRKKGLLHLPKPTKKPARTESWKNLTTTQDRF